MPPVTDLRTYDRRKRIPTASGTTLTGIRSAAAGTDVLSSGVTGDAQDRFIINADGSHELGSGAAATDVGFERSAANTLRLTRGAGAAGNVILSGVADMTIQPVGQLYLNAASGVNVLKPLIMNSQNIQSDATTGTKIGTATTQKLGFFNATPVVQPASPGADATDLASVITLANTIKARLVALGLTA